MTVEDWGCTRNTSDPNDVYNNPKTTCDPPALTYSVEDYWQEKMTQGLSALFTYSVLLATPWRVSILAHRARMLTWRHAGPRLHVRPATMFSKFVF